MYITLQSIKRNLGLFNLEMKDLILGTFFAILFIILFLLNLYTLATIIFSIGIILLFPVDFSRCNRTYKLFCLFINFIFKDKNYYIIKDV